MRAVIGVVLTSLIIGLFVVQRPHHSGGKSAVDIGLRVVVCGASSGIGEHIVYKWARLNATLVIVARRRAHLDAVAQRALELGAQNVYKVVADFAKSEADVVIHSAVSHLGGIDVLHLNHAILSSMDWVTGANISHLKLMMQVTFFSFVELATAALPHLDLSNGRIVVSSSAAGETGVQGMSSYSAAKHALHGFFDSFRQDLLWHHSNISVTIAVLGRFDTEGATQACQGKGDFGHAHRFVHTLPAETAGSAIVEGAISRLPEVRFPRIELTLNWLFAAAMPAVHGALVGLSANSHPCTNTYHEALMLISCFQEVRALLM